MSSSALPPVGSGVGSKKDEVPLQRVPARDDGDSDSESSSDVFNLNTGGKDGEDFAHAPPPSFFTEHIEDCDTFMNLSQTETLYDALKRLDQIRRSKGASERLVTSFNGTGGYFSQYHVREGQLGRGYRNGQTHFWPPGSYWRIGVGAEWIDEVVIHGNGDIMEWGDITYAHVTEHQAVVCEHGENQFILGQGRYLMQQPTHLVGSRAINLTRLRQEDHILVQSEESSSEVDANGRVRITDRVVDKNIPAGQRDELDAVGFFRPSPGFLYAIQRPDGTIRTGSNFTVARGREMFIEWINLQDFARTTPKFAAKSADRYEATLRVQITWCLRDGTKWLMRRGAYADPFDKLDEEAQGAFRDEISKYTHSQILEQERQGYDGLENNLWPRLEKAALRIGAKLINLQVRELKFPLLDEQERRLATAEEDARQRGLEIQRQMERQRILDQQAIEQQTAEESRRFQAATAKTKVQEIENQRKREDQEADLSRDQDRLTALKDQEQIKADTLRTKALGEANAEAARREAEANAELNTAKLRAEAYREIEEGKIALKVKEAEADAEAARTLGAAFKGCPELLQFKMAELMMNERIAKFEAIKAFADSPNALLPEILQQDLLRMENGYPPQEYMPAALAVGGQPESGSRR